MPNNVEDVRFRMDRVRLGGEVPLSLASSSSGFVFSGEGVAGSVEGVDAGVISKARRGKGRRIGG
jgi:hypothetical protein